MLTLSLCTRSPSPFNKLRVSTQKICPLHQTRIVCRSSLQVQGHRLSSLSFNPLRELVMNKKGYGFGAVCHSGLLTPPNLQWVSTISTAVLMLARGTSIHRSFLAPLFALQAPASIVSWIKGEYGIWTAFLALLVRLFFFIPGELELPFITLLLVILAPNQVTSRLRGTQEGIILSLLIAAYLAFQHFYRPGSLARSFDQGSIFATLAIICIIIVSCLLLIQFLS
ncbi:cold-regulated 413 inner membrane protein 2, chloroplastic-like [Primulina huaijiensis]|uniref:cold-regulated 413 inner membrane protein 2, chloroplastic-like n=1 Tax=Primulina huaijiensis TaxID=1492673 RepID=UPI003CC76097